MGLIQTAFEIAQEAPIDNPSIPVWAFGVFTFLALGALLGVTMMLKVGP
ncbi:MAG: hypothetical protein Q8M73_12875 [Actinomycetota bacterium]|nr:hypothetical protein [Actinomycetota bacterium]